MANDLGFGKSKPSLNLSDFKTKPSSKKAPSQRDQERFEEDQRVDELAERQGFTSREKTTRVKKKRKAKSVTDTAYVRAPIDVLNAFKVYCNERDLTYGEGLEQLLKERSQG